MKTKISPHKLGFTLVEVLIVLVVLGAIAGLAIPNYSKSVERARRSEAIRHLSALRESLNRYKSVNSGTYTGAHISKWIGASEVTNLDYDPGEADDTGQTYRYTYWLRIDSPEAFTIAARPLTPGQTRATTRAVNFPDGQHIEMDQTGTITEVDADGTRTVLSK